MTREGSLALQTTFKDGHKPCIFLYNSSIILICLPFSVLLLPAVDT